MQPIEINAGTYYLRALRADKLMDDRPALADLGITEPGYVEQCARDWARDTRYSWAVCEPTTGEMLGEVTLTPATGMIGVQARDGHAAAVRGAADAVRRFAESLKERP